MSSSPSQSGPLEKFLEKILEHREETDVELDSESLRDLAVKYGLDQEAYEELVHEAKEHRARGILFFEHGNWDDAIAELDQAYVVLPHDSEVGFVLGKAYARQYREGKEDSDRALSEKFFRQCIKRDSTHSEAVRELTELEKLADEVANSSVSYTPAVIAVVMLLVVGGAYLFLPMNRGETKSSGEEKVVFREKLPQAEALSSKETGSVTIPVDFPLSEVGDDFSFNARSSVLTRYEGKYGYELLGTILAGQITISKMRATVELMGEDEKVFVRHEFDILPSHRSAVVAGDSIPFRVLIFEQKSVPEIVEARLTLNLFEHSPFLGASEPGKLLELTETSVTLPPDYGVEIRERNVLRSKGVLGDDEKALLKLILTLENKGKRQIEQMKFQTSVTGADGESIPLGYSSITKHFSNLTPGEFTAVSKIHPPLLPGELRVVEASIYLPDTSPEDINGYRLRLLGIE